LTCCFTGAEGSVEEKIFLKKFKMALFLGGYWSGFMAQSAAA
jgi:hypothetical protein